MGRGRPPPRAERVVYQTMGRRGLCRAPRGLMAENVGWRWIFCASAAVSLVGMLLAPTYVLRGTYQILAIGAFPLFGIGLAFSATPSTDAAISNLPDDPAGFGSGVYKMAAALGASFGVATSAVMLTALSGDNAPVDWIADVITVAGRQDNLAIREAALFAFGANLLMIVGAIIAILLTAPKGRLHEETRQ
jgi:MFS transporter, DHA2 family, multidrug resistance protein